MADLMHAGEKLEFVTKLSRDCDLIRLTINQACDAGAVLSLKSNQATETRGISCSSTKEHSGRGRSQC